MSTLKYSILGLLSQNPMTGYDIAKEFSDHALSNFWYATHGQIYPELNKLVKEGLVKYEVVIQGNTLEKKLYTVTPEGSREFREWLVTDEPVEQTPKDIFRLRTFFSEFAPNESFIALLQSQLAQHRYKCERLQTIMQDTYNGTRPEIGTSACGDYMVLDGAILRENSYITWLLRCLEAYGEDVSGEML
ncbi:MAG: PadR family transcriptional regulator [Lachnospiraceae bacterium]|nr:PadR family transcriptional regulator [Lachnospiraceae bacterium]